MPSHYSKRRAAALDDGGEEYQQRRSAIMDAAANVFKSKGFGSTNVSDIARGAGIDRATLYYYFGSKEEIFEEAVRSAVEQNAVRAEEIRKSDADAPTKLRTLIISLMESYAAHYPFLYVFIQENLTHVAGDRRQDWATQMRRLNRRYEDAIIGIVRDGIDERTMKVTGDPRIVAWGLLGMLGWTNRWFNPDESHESAHEIGVTFADMVLEGLVVHDAPAD
jgi:TetR/AcrR family transcriptional regulator, cholesterol catabolism regulator